LNHEVQAKLQDLARRKRSIGLIGARKTRQRRSRSTGGIFTAGREQAMQQQHSEMGQAQGPRSLSTENDDLRRKYAGTFVYQLREIYGKGFAPGIPADLTVCQVLDELDRNSLAFLVRKVQA
jgi:hypothetical protein